MTGWYEFGTPSILESTSWCNCVFRPYQEVAGRGRFQCADGGFLVYKNNCGDKKILRPSYFPSYFSSDCSCTGKSPYIDTRPWLLRICITTNQHWLHYDDVIMSKIASQITSLTIVYSTVLSGADQGKHQSSASLSFVWEIHWWPVNFPHKWPVTRKIFLFDDVIMFISKFSPHLVISNVLFILS